MLGKMSAYNCSDPYSVSNGYYVIDKSYYEDGDQVYFICFSTYSLNGNPTLTCDGSTGSWSGTYPTCTSSATTKKTASQDYEGKIKIIQLTEDRVINNKTQIKWTNTSHLPRQCIKLLFLLCDMCIWLSDILYPLLHTIARNNYFRT